MGQQQSCVTVGTASENKWNNRMKTILVSITGMTPPIEGIPVGLIISSLLSIFWPDSEKDIWSLIKDQVEGLIDEKILEYELQEIQNEIKALQKTMEMYVEAKIQEKGSLMSTMIYGCNGLFFRLTQSKNSVQLIPLLVTHSAQHLLILKERLLHGEEIYSEDNTDVWRKELEDQISSYKDSMKDIYFKWVEWRKSKITVHFGYYCKVGTIGSYAEDTVCDEVTKDKANYRANTHPINHFTTQCEATKRKMFSLQNGELLKIMLPTFYLDNYIPGNEDNPSVIPPYLSIASFGPISPHIGGGNEHACVFAPGEDNWPKGEVTSINVREGDVIDGIQIFYSTHTGSFYGNSKGGRLHEIPLNNRSVKSIKLCYDNNNIVEITIGFSNGDSTGPMGDQRKRKSRCVNTGGIDHYALYNIRAQGYGNKEGLFQIELDYKAYSVRPSEMENRALYFVDLGSIATATAQCGENVLTQSGRMGNCPNDGYPLT